MVSSTLQLFHLRALIVFNHPIQLDFFSFLLSGTHQKSVECSRLSGAKPLLSWGCTS